MGDGVVLLVSCEGKPHLEEKSRRPGGEVGCASREAVPPGSSHPNSIPSAFKVASGLPRMSGN